MRSARPVPSTAFASILFLLLLAATAAAPAHADAACEEDCGLTYWSCSDACGAFGGALCEQNCSNAYSSCMTHCAHCPSNRDYSTFVVTSTTSNFFTSCYKNPLHFDTTGHLYDQYTSHQTVSNWRETTNCDYSKTTTLLSTTTANVTCWIQHFGGPASCSPFTTVGLYACP